jgi:hypothetical protein
MRYRATIYVDIWAEEGRIAGKKLEKIVKSVPNSFSDGLSALPHGSEISLVSQEPKCS